MGNSIPIRCNQDANPNDSDRHAAATANDLFRHCKNYKGTWLEASISGFDSYMFAVISSQWHYFSRVRVHTFARLCVGIIATC